LVLEGSAKVLEFELLGSRLKVEEFS